MHSCWGGSFFVFFVVVVVAPNFHGFKIKIGRMFSWQWDNPFGEVTPGPSSLDVLGWFRKKRCIDTPFLRAFHWHPNWKVLVIYTWNPFYCNPFFLQEKVFSNWNKGHLGYRYVYIENICTNVSSACIWSYDHVPNQPNRLNKTQVASPLRTTVFLLGSKSNTVFQFSITIQISLLI